MLTEKIPTVWWVQCKPFPPELRESDECRKFQEECANNNFFGMGWKWDNFNQYAGQPFSWEIANKLYDYIKQQSNESPRTFSGAQKKYSNMSPGDVVVTRLNDRYFAGIIDFTPKMSDNERLTWYSKVKDKWTVLGTSEDLPHHVRGLLSSRKYHGTVAEITGLSAFTILEKVGVICSKQRVNSDSFVLALGDEDLEDLMAHYMITQNDGYVFLPSSCKKNTPGIEYVMYKPSTNETISCQTKVNKEIDVGYYSQDHYREYMKIYLYSGKGYYNNDDIPDNVYIVSNDDLYKVFIHNTRFTNLVKQYFDFEH